MLEHQPIPAGARIEDILEDATPAQKAIARIILEPISPESAARVRQEQERLERSGRPSDSSRRQPCTW